MLTKNPITSALDFKLSEFMQNVRDDMCTKKSTDKHPESENATNKTGDFEDFSPVDMINHVSLLLSSPLRSSLLSRFSPPFSKHALCDSQ